VLRAVAFTVVLASIAAPVAAQTVHTPAPGSAERRAILDTVRAPLREQVGGQVEFVVEVLRVGDGWAWLEARPRRPGGGDIPPGDAFDDNTTYAMLHQVDGRWTIDHWSYGSNDAWWVFYCDKPGRLVVAEAC
jgi:hypothetical protein